MNIEQVIEYFEKREKHLETCIEDWNESNNAELLCSVKIMEPELEKVQIILSALRAQQERENQKPLTLEKLKQINKEPLKHWVWIEIIDGNVESGWRITHADYTNGETFCCGYPGISWHFKYSEYGKTWLAYDHEPKGVSNQNER